MRITDITNAINTLKSAAGVKKELIYTNGSNWSFLSGNDATLNSLASTFDLWNAAHDSFTSYVDPAGNLYCATDDISSLVPGLRGGTGVPSLGAPGFGSWTAGQEVGTQFDVGGNEGVKAACLFGVQVDFDVFSPALFQ
jgi:hypothetical protein